MCRGEEKQPADINNARFVIARDEFGHWIVKDRKGLIGGTFTDRAAALHFAMTESGYRDGAVYCMPDTVIIKGDFGKSQPVM